MDRGTKLTLAVCFVVFSVTLYLSPQSYGTNTRRSPMTESGGELRVMLVGDYGTGDESQRRVAVHLAAVARELRPQFVLAAGDSFYSGGVKDEYDPQFLAKFEHMYDAASLQVFISLFILIKKKK